MSKITELSLNLFANKSSAENIEQFYIMKNKSLVQAWTRMEGLLQETREYDNNNTEHHLKYAKLVPKLPNLKATPIPRPKSAAIRHTRTKSAKDPNYSRILGDSVIKEPSRTASMVVANPLDVTTSNPNRDFTQRRHSTSHPDNTQRPLSSRRPLPSAKFSMNTTDTSMAMTASFLRMQRGRPASSASRAIELFVERYNPTDADEVIHTVRLGDLTRIYEAKCRDNKNEYNRDQLTHFFEKFRRNSVHRVFKMDDLFLGPESGAIVAEILLRNQHFTKVHIGKNFISDSGAVLFAEILRFNNTIIELDISSNNITHVGAEAIFDALVKNQSLISLKIHSQEGLNRNRLDSRGAKPLAEVLRENQTLQFLNISGVGLNAEGVGYICDGLEENESLSALNLSKNDVGPSLSDSLLGCLGSCKLMELDIAGNRLGNKGLMTLANVFWASEKRICKLKKLNIADNNFEWPGLSRLFDSLNKNLYLETLILDNNSLSGKAVMCMVNFLWENESIRYLSMNNCRLETDACDALSNGLDRNKTVETLHLANNYIKNQGAQSLAMAFSSPSSVIKDFDFQSCGIRDEGGIALADAMKVNTHIERVNLRDNSLYDDAALAIAEAAGVNKNLKKLLLERNPISRKYMLEIEKIVRTNVNKLIKGRAGKFENTINELREYELQKFVVQEEQKTLQMKEKEAKEAAEAQQEEFFAERERERKIYSDLEDQLGELIETLRKLDNERREIENFEDNMQGDFQTLKELNGRETSELYREISSLENETRRLRDSIKTGKAILVAQKERLTQEIQVEMQKVKVMEASLASTEKEIVKMTQELEQRKIAEEEAAKREETKGSDSPRKSTRKSVSVRRSTVKSGPDDMDIIEAKRGSKRSSVIRSKSPQKPNPKIGP